MQCVLIPASSSKKERVAYNTEHYNVLVYKFATLVLPSCRLVICGHPPLAALVDSSRKSNELYSAGSNSGRENILLPFPLFEAAVLQLLIDFLLEEQYNMDHER